MPHLAGRAVSAALLALLFSAAPAQAAQDARTRDLRTNRAAAERALAQAQRIAAGQGVRTGRELSEALRALAARLPALSPSDREAAEGLLARPTDPGDTGQVGGPYTVASVKDCTSASFCIHWVQSTDDAPSLADGPDAGTRPDYIDLMIASFEQTRAVENGALAWLAPESDGTRGGDGKTDVYVKELGDFGLYGYASMDPGQSGDNRRFAFLAMDNDYAADEFPQYAGDPTKPVQVTAAHEYNHVLQFGYDFNQDTWMFESTATWMEEKVFPAVDDYLQYMAAGWAGLAAIRHHRGQPREDVRLGDLEPLARSPLRRRRRSGTRGRCRRSAAASRPAPTTRRSR